MEWTGFRLCSCCHSPFRWDLQSSWYSQQALGINRFGAPTLGQSSSFAVTWLSCRIRICMHGDFIYLLYVNNHQDCKLMGSDRKYTRIPHSSVYIRSNLEEEEVVSGICKVSIGFCANVSLLLISIILSPCVIVCQHWQQSSLTIAALIFYEPTGHSIKSNTEETASCVY
jgi:hypothetical protein